MPDESKQVELKEERPLSQYVVLNARGTRIVARTHCNPKLQVLDVARGCRLYFLFYLVSKSRQMCVCLCVWTIWRYVKLLTWWSFGFQFQFLPWLLLHFKFPGEWSRLAELHLTKLSAVSWGYHWRRPVTYLHSFDHLLFRVCFHFTSISFFVSENGIRPSHKPASRISTNLRQPIWFPGTSWRNSLAMAMVTSQCFQVPSPTHSCQVEWKCFWT